MLIVSADKDLMQLVHDGVTFYDFESGIQGKPGYRPERRLDRAGVIEKFGVPPEQVPDVQALVGDPTDNVPGVPGVGPKAAAALIGELGSLEAILAYKDRPEELDAVLSGAARGASGEIDALAGAAGQDQLRRPDRRGADGRSSASPTCRSTRRASRPPMPRRSSGSAATTPSAARSCGPATSRA